MSRESTRHTWVCRDAPHDCRASPELRAERHRQAGGGQGVDAGKRGADDPVHEGLHGDCGRIGHDGGDPAFDGISKDAEEAYRVMAAVQTGGDEESRDEMSLPGILSAPQINTKYKPNKAKKAGENARIEMLGLLNDRHLRALASGDREALLELAGEYVFIGCPNMGSQITAEAMNL